MAISDLSLAIVLSVADLTVYGPFVQDKSLRFPSITVSFEISLYHVSEFFAPLSGRCSIRGGRLTYNRSPGCNHIRNRTFLSKPSLYLLCAAGCLWPAFSIA